jgi:hypothetical protein
MKKELLIASALVGTVGIAGVAEAASATFSGHTRNGVKSTDTNDADSAFSGSQQASFSVSISETTDAGVQISTGIGLSDEGAGTGNDNNPSGLTLTFTDGSKLDLVEAGNAYATHLAAVPGASGEQSVGTNTTLNSAPTALTWANKSATTGLEYHSAADALGVEGLKFGISYSVGDDGDASSTSSVENSYSVGASYVTTAGDSTVTIGGGFVTAEDSNSTSSNEAASSFAGSATVVTGDLTVGLGVSTGSEVEANTSAQETMEVDSAEITTAGASYVSGDITFAVGYASGEASDTIVLGSNGSNTDEYTNTAASVTYTIASGVSATIGYSDTERTSEGTAATNDSGSSWYVGALVSF